jgi:hypothetical protein
MVPVGMEERLSHTQRIGARGALPGLEGLGLNMPERNHQRGGSVPKGTEGRAHCAGVSDSTAAWLTA